MFSEIAEIALVAARLGQFLKTRVISILSFTRPHAITHTKRIIHYEIKIHTHEINIDPEHGPELQA